MHLKVLFSTCPEFSLTYDSKLLISINYNQNILKSKVFNNFKILLKNTLDMCI